MRTLKLTQISLATHQTFAALESISQELHILSMAPPEPQAQRPNDERRERSGRGQESYSDRLDPPIAQLLAGGRGGPILSKDGRPLQPFTLLDSRERLRQGVFRPGHNLPTMTIDEYLEEERRRGGMIEGGGEQSLQRPEVDEDDMERADQETMKAREWDEFKEANPKSVEPTPCGALLTDQGIWEHNEQRLRNEWFSLMPALISLSRRSIRMRIALNLAEPPALGRSIAKGSTTNKSVRSENMADVFKEQIVTLACAFED